MTINKQDEFDERLHRLERENRAFKRLFALALACVLVLIAAGFDRADDVKKVVEAERFVLRGANGKERIRISTDAAAQAAWIILFNSDQKEVAYLYADDREKSSVLTLQNPDGSAVTSLSMKEDGTSHFTVEKADKKVLCSIGMHGNDKLPKVFILDREGNVKFEAPKE
jgi:hypothetical protein